ncbi:MAG: hypothetical protein J0M35_02250 [Candidatus Obscuribacter phosphatis]|uniref:Uncharacterized protein n=1 Tax=Candidatus Obscuribacter phosphatis TaxID=1906157 RepID=A0A8J7TJX1_9BACT|nr:hypothetical protein [Candidatus Obscuribacter phosphatis]
MDPSSIVPLYQPIPFPAPVWLLETLLILGFFLHALPMNVVLGGGFLSAALIFAGKENREGYLFRTGKALATALPLFISFAVTQGIVPLLFVQLLYGPAFYTSSILMAVPWLSVLLIIIVSYYLSYVVIYRYFKSEKALTASGAVQTAALLLVMSLGFALVGFLFSNNMTLMLTPAKWLSMYSQNPNGLHLNLSEGTLIPRYLHFFVASFATAGITLGLFGLYIAKRNAEFSNYMIKLGSRIYLAFTLLQVPVGFWYLKSLPPEFMHKFMGGDTIAFAIFGAAMLFTLVAVVTSAMASQSGNSKAYILSLISNAVIILLMIINRHQLRVWHMNSFNLNPNNVPVSTQWDLLITFVLSAVALIVYLVWLCKLVAKAYAPKDGEALPNT